MKLLLIILILTLIRPVLTIIRGEVDFKADYRTANRQSVNLAPQPDQNQEAVVQVYAARAFNWRGLIASHIWIATKAENDLDYKVYQVVGWRKYQNLPVVFAEKDIPDRSWFGANPKIILDIRGAKAQELLQPIDQAAKSYPYSNQYTIWPGPNSNSFIAHIARKIPNLGLVMPEDAIGKDFLTGKTLLSKLFAPAPSNTGYQISLFGLAGILIAKKEGIEINLLGLSYGVRLAPFKILLPGSTD